MQDKLCKSYYAPYISTRELRAPAGNCDGLKIEENMGAAQATEQIGDGVSRSTTFTSGWQGASPQEEIVQDLYIKRPLALRGISYGEFAGYAIRVLRI